MQEPDAEHTGVVAPPPVIYGIALVLVLGLEWVAPLPLWPAPIGFRLGVVLLVAGVVWNGWGVLTLRRNETAVHPTHPASRIVTTGPFAYSRNPLYLGLNVAFAGIALMLDSSWGLIVLIPVLVLMHYGVIRREEQHLHARFGDEYTAYRRRVRRYL